MQFVVPRKVDIRYIVSGGLVDSKLEIDAFKTPWNPERSEPPVSVTKYRLCYLA
jgi:hypothetical protein